MHFSPRAFGKYVRGRRLTAGMTLRQLAKHVDVSPTYISHIEQGKTISPPTADRIRRIANILGEHSDELILRAGRLPDDLVSIIAGHPSCIPELLRHLADLEPEQLAEVVAYVNNLKFSQPEPRVGD